MIRHLALSLFLGLAACGGPIDSDDHRNWLGTHAITWECLSGCAYDPPRFTELDELAISRDGRDTFRVQLRKRGMAVATTRGLLDTDCLVLDGLPVSGRIASDPVLVCEEGGEVEWQVAKERGVYLMLLSPPGN